MKSKLLLAFIIICGIADAQNPTWQWAKSQGRFTSHDYCYGIGTDSHGNSYITGQFQDTINFGNTTLINTGTYGQNMFIAKYDASGNVLWANIPGGNNGATGNDVCTDNDGNFYVTGSYRGTITFGSTTFTASGIANFFVAKYDSSGNVIWAKNSICNASNLGKSICTGGDGDVFVTGTFEDSSITFGSITVPTNFSIIGSSVFVVKFDNTGNAVWAKTAGGTNTDVSNSVCTDKKGNAYITGVYHNSITFGSTTLLATNGSAAVFVTKYDVLGNVLWAKTSGGFPSSGYGKGISTDGNGNCYVTGYFNSPIIIFEDDTLTNAGINDIFLLKYDSLGGLTWSKREGGIDYDEGTSIHTDDNGNSFVTGFFKSNVNFGGTFCFGNGQELYVVKFDSSGSILWAAQSHGNLNEVGYGVGVDANENVYIGGSFSSPTSMFGTTTLTNSDIYLGSYDLYIAKLNNSTTSIADENNSVNAITIFPNPFSNKTTLQFDNRERKSFTLEIFDTQGRLVSTIKNINSDRVEIYREGLTDGLYFYQLSSNREVKATGKLILNAD